MREVELLLARGRDGRQLDHRRTRRLLLLLGPVPDVADGAVPVLLLVLLSSALLLLDRPVPKVRRPLSTEFKNRICFDSTSDVGTRLHQSVLHWVAN